MVISPGDIRGTEPLIEKCTTYCCGVAGGAGPNLACSRCDQAVATRIDDCGYWHEIWLDPHATQRGPEGPDEREVDWERWPATRPDDDTGSLIWESALGKALADLLNASGGLPVELPGALGVLRRFMPKGTPVVRAALAGPCLPPSNAEIVVVPRHPLTGRPWEPPHDSDAAVVALDTGVWVYLAYRRERPVSAVEFAEDPPPDRPPRVTYSRSLFVRTLEPRLRALCER